MTETIYCLIVSGYAKKGDLGWDEPKMLYAGRNQIAAEAAFNVLQTLGDGLESIGGKWIPLGEAQDDVRYFIAPKLSFILPVTDHTDNEWYAIITEEKDFLIDHDTESFTVDGEVYTSKPSDFTACKDLRFHTVREDQFFDVLEAHKCGTSDSDHRVVYFTPDEHTLTF